ncbi:hypothetical protein NEOLEDRAFT_1020185, partial [Neolentinus lepideus HHB14362 ss-1]
LGYSLSGPSMLYIDNQSALAVVKNPEHHGCMKHLDLQFYWLQDEMPADCGTKALAKGKVDIMVGLLGLA